MATSKIPGFKSALVTRLQADADIGGAGVQVTYGPPAPAGPDREWVWVGAARATQETAAMGQRRREERWVQDIQVSVLNPVRETQQSVTERAFVIAGHVEDSLREWGETAGSYFSNLVRWALVAGMDLEEFITTDERGAPKDREARITIRVDCAERI